MKAASILLTLVTLTGLVATSAGSAQENLTVGALLPLSGVSADAGLAEMSALELAQEDVGLFLSWANRDLQINLLVEDTQSDPGAAPAALDRLEAKGVKVVIGPEDSASLAGVREQADSKGIILISCSSTAPSLAVANDTTFRLAPDDSRLAEALASLMVRGGIRAVIPLARNDLWADEMVNATTSSFVQQGGTVLAGVNYSPGETNFTAEMDHMGEKVRKALKSYDPESVAVMVAAFEEVVPMTARAYQDPVLSSVRWYAADPSATLIQHDLKAAKMALESRLTYPLFGDQENDVYKRLAERLGEEDPNPYAINAYDALWLIVKAHLVVGSEDPEKLLHVLPEVARVHRGPIGSTALNLAGDRELGYYTFVSAEEVDGSLQWVPLAVYTTYPPDHKLLIILEPPPGVPDLRVLVVNSYHPGWALEDDLLSGIENGLLREGFAEGEDYQLMTFWMDTKVNHTTLESIAAQGDLALDLIERWQPDLVFVNDDNALKYVAVAYAELQEGDLPFIFSGTNIDPSVYPAVGSLERPAGTLTGTLERVPFGFAFDMALELFPEAEKILLLSDASQSSLSNRAEFDAWYAQYGNETDLEVVDFLQTSDFEEWKGMVREYQDEVDLLGIVAYQGMRDEKGEPVSPGEVAAWTLENSRAPPIGLVASNARDGMIMGVGVSYYETGVYAGIVGGEVVKGRAPSEFPIVDPGFAELILNRERAMATNVTLPLSVLLNADKVYG